MKNTFFTKYDVKISNDLLTVMYTISERMTAAEVVLLLDLVQRGGANNEIPLSLSQIMHDCNISRPTACNALKRLRERGLVTSSYTQGETTPALVAVNAEKSLFTIVPKSAVNACFELIRAGGLSFTALRLLLFVWRFTYGFRGKNGDSTEPKSIFSDSFIHKGTGIQKHHAHRAIKELVKVGAIRFNGRYKEFDGDYEIIYRNGIGIEVKRFTAQSTQFEQTALEFVKDQNVENIAKCKKQEIQANKGGYKNLTRGGTRTLLGGGYINLTSVENCKESSDPPETLETLENTGKNATSGESDKNLTSKVFVTQQTLYKTDIDKTSVYKTTPPPNFAPMPIVENVESLESKADEESETEDPKRPERELITADEWLNSFTDEEKKAQKEAIGNVTKSNLEYLQESAEPTGYNFMDILHYAEQHGGSLQGFEKHRQGGQADE